MVSRVHHSEECETAQTRSSSSISPSSYKNLSLLDLFYASLVHSHAPIKYLATKLSYFPLVFCHLVTLYHIFWRSYSRTPLPSIPISLLQPTPKPLFRAPVTLSHSLRLYSQLHINVTTTWYYTHMPLCHWNDVLFSKMYKTKTGQLVI